MCFCKQPKPLGIEQVGTDAVHAGHPGVKFADPLRLPTEAGQGNQSPGIFFEGEPLRQVISDRKIDRHLSALSRRVEIACRLSLEPPWKFKAKARLLTCARHRPAARPAWIISKAESGSRGTRGVSPVQPAHNAGVLGWSEGHGTVIIRLAIVSSIAMPLFSAAEASVSRPRKNSVPPRARHTCAAERCSCASARVTSSSARSWARRSSPARVVIPQPPHDREQLHRSAKLIAQRPGPAVGPFNLRSRIALGRS